MMQQELDIEQWLSLSQAAKRLNIHPTTLRRWADNGDIPVMVTPGGHRRFPIVELERFSQARHGVRRLNSIEQIWADRALTVTRQGVSTPENVPWMSTIDEHTREQNRMMGRELMALTLQYISNEGDVRLLDEARRIGYEYGRTCQRIGMPLADALRAAIFFRDTMIETALQLPENVNIRPEANMSLLRRINNLLNAVHLAIAEVYDANHNRMLGT